jgi:hypothetical protein
MAKGGCIVLRVKNQSKEVEEKSINVLPNQ